MSYLRLVHSALPPAQPERACVAAFDRELDYVFASLRRLGAQANELEDLAQEIFVVLLRNWEELDTSRSLRPYLFGIAFRIVSAQRRKLRRESLVPLPDLEDQAASPQRALEDRQVAALIGKALGQVPVTRRAVLILHDLDDVPVTEIARSLSLTRFGVYARLRKARKELALAFSRLQKGAPK